MELNEVIKQKGLELGFDLVGITTAAPIDSGQIEHLNRWLACGRAGQMRYLDRNIDKRTNPARLLEGAQSVICTALCYKPAADEPAPDILSGPPCGRIANYALYEDYHTFIKDLLGKLLSFIKTVSGRQDLRFKVCVDSAPLAERALAQRAGLGFIGKNHILINPYFGPQLLLGEIVTDLKLKPDEPMKNRCSGCEKCVTACPAGALGFDGSFDATKCISYLTTEYEGVIPQALAVKIGCRLFGCDECILACPFNDAAHACTNRQYHFYPDRRWMNLHTIRAWQRPQFTQYFAGSAIERLGLERLKRNAIICEENARLAYGARNTSF